jgi:hypothetical protein
MHSLEPLPGLLPPAGPHTERIFDKLLPRLDGLQCCEHRPGDFTMWISTRPDRLLCSSCYWAAQQAPGIRCAACHGPAGDPDNDAVIVGKISEFIGAHVYLCRACYAIDISASHAN